MTYAIDGNVLLYASDDASPFHAQAVGLIDDIALGPEIVYLFWPTVMAYLRIATHPAVFEQPLGQADARSNIAQLLALPNVEAIGEQGRFWQLFTEVADDVLPTGNLVTDAHIAALMLENGVRTIVTHDRDYRKFPGITVRDPFTS